MCIYQVYTIYKVEQHTTYQYLRFLLDKNLLSCRYIKQLKIMGLGDLFVKSVTREIGRNVGKGLSNDMFGDWHSTPVRIAGSNSRKAARKQGWDISYVKSEEYDISKQPEWKPNYGVFGSFLVNLLLCIFILPIFILPFFAIKDFIRTKTSLYARVPMRRADGRTKSGYRDLGTYSYIQLKQNRLLTTKEKNKSKLNGAMELLGVLGGMFFWNWIYTGNIFDFTYFVEMFSGGEALS